MRCAVEVHRAIHGIAPLWSDSTHGNEMPFDVRRRRGRRKGAVIVDEGLPLDGRVRNEAVGGDLAGGDFEAVERFDCGLCHWFG